MIDREKLNKTTRLINQVIAHTRIPVIEDVEKLFLNGLVGIFGINLPRKWNGLSI